MKENIQLNGKLIKSVLHKGSDNDECGNYRPLTMLSIHSKITESIICDTIDPHLNEMLQKHQWGYGKGQSSESLLYLTESWKQSIGEGKVVGAIFMDFRKALNSVSHDILHYKNACLPPEWTVVLLVAELCIKSTTVCRVKWHPISSTRSEIWSSSGFTLSPRTFFQLCKQFF